MWQRIDAFALWYWRRLLRVPWIARRSNQSVLKEINPECSLEGLMLKPKLQHFGHLMWRANSLEKTLVLGKTEGKRRWGDRGWMASLTQWTWIWANSEETVEDRGAWCAAVHGVAKLDMTWQLDNMYKVLSKTCLWDHCDLSQCLELFPLTATKISNAQGILLTKS